MLPYAFCIVTSVASETHTFTGRVCSSAGGFRLSRNPRSPKSAPPHAQGIEPMKRPRVKLAITIIRMLKRPAHKNYLRQLLSDLPGRCIAYVVMHGPIEQLKRKEVSHLRAWIRNGGKVLYAENHMNASQCSNYAYRIIGLIHKNATVFGFLDDDAFLAPASVTTIKNAFARFPRLGYFGPRPAAMPRRTRYTIMKKDQHPYGTSGARFLRAAIANLHDERMDRMQDSDIAISIEKRGYSRVLAKMDITHQEGWSIRSKKIFHECIARMHEKHDRDGYEALVGRIGAYNLRMCEQVNEKPTKILLQAISKKPRKLNIKPLFPDVPQLCNEVVWHLT